MLQVNITDNKTTFYTQPTAKKAKYVPRAENNMTKSIQGERIGFGEGCRLFLGGAIKQGKEMVDSIIQHPLRTVALISGTTLAMMSLPLIGIPSAVGAGVFAIGFAGLSMTKALQHAKQFINTNKNRDYNTARLYIQQLGEDSFDLALSAPFIPKAVTNIRNFAKYGRFGVNNTLINEIKETQKFTDKMKVIRRADIELSRNFNFQRAVDNEIANLKNITDAEKLSIKKELMEFNVSIDKIPEIVLQKFAQIKGVKTMPNLKYITMSPSTHGLAVADDCTIYLNDYKPYKGQHSFSNYTSIKQELIGDKYQFTYKYQPTGEIIKETIDTKILDDYNKLCRTYKKLSPQSTRILTILHEREHIHQFAQAFKLKGFGWTSGELEPSGKALFKKMMAEIKKPKKGSAEALKIESFTYPAENGTPLAYVKRPLEIWGRKIEHEAINNPMFQKLDNIHKVVNKFKSSPVANDVLLNNIRLESANT